VAQLAGWATGDHKNAFPALEWIIANAEAGGWLSLKPYLEGRIALGREKPIWGYPALYASTAGRIRNPIPSEMETQAMCERRLGSLKGSPYNRKVLGPRWRQSK